MHRRKAAGQTALDYATARDDAVHAITSPKPLAPASDCNPDCLKKQLDEYYKECANASLRVHDGMGGNGADIFSGDNF
jgi:hypothetical protein